MDSSNRAVHREKRRKGGKEVAVFFPYFLRGALIRRSPENAEVVSRFSFSYFFFSFLDRISLGKTKFTSDRYDA